MLLQESRRDNPHQSVHHVLWHQGRRRLHHPRKLQRWELAGPSTSSDSTTTSRGSYFMEPVRADSPTHEDNMSREDVANPTCVATTAVESSAVESSEFEVVDAEF